MISAATLKNVPVLKSTFLMSTRNAVSRFGDASEMTDRDHDARDEAPADAIHERVVR